MGGSSLQFRQWEAPSTAPIQAAPAAWLVTSPNLVRGDLHFLLTASFFCSFYSKVCLFYIYPTCR